MTSRLLIISAAVFVLAAACTPQSTPRTSRSNPSPTHPIAGRCAETVFTNAEPPEWSQSGWTVPKGAPWPVRWTLASSGDAVAFMFAGELVAGPSPRSDGSNNKILWVLRDPAPFVVEGRPAGESKPVVTVPGGPSIVDVPTPGCWTFELIRSDSVHQGTISLNVLPHGSKPT
jgi:hypothetical protein